MRAGWLVAAGSLAGLAMLTVLLPYAGILITTGATLAAYLGTRAVTRLESQQVRIVKSWPTRHVRPRSVLQIGQ